MPPTSLEEGGLSGRRLRQSEAAHFRVDPGAALPLLELQRAQTVADPFIVVGEDSRRVRQMEVQFPPWQVSPQFRDYPTQAPSTVASGYLPHALLERESGFGSDPAHHRAALGVPEAVAQEAAFLRQRHLALVAVDAQPEFAVHPLQRLHHSPARLDRT